MSVPPVVSQDEKTWGLLGHLSSLVGFVIPFGNILGPLVVWLVKKDTMPFAADHAKEALNFNITLAIAGIVCAILMLVFIGFLLLPLLVVAWVVMTILAALAANKGESYRYPFTLRLVH